jgi:hypothetical protein
MTTTLLEADLDHDAHCDARAKHLVAAIIERASAPYRAHRIARTKRLVANIKAEEAAEMAAANDNRPTVVPSARPTLKATPFTLRDPALIPVRQILFAGHYTRRFLTATFGAGGGGKSAHAVTECMSMVTGRPLLGGGLMDPLRVWYVNLEDPVDEIERRFAAAALHFNVNADQIGDRLYTDSGREQEFVVMKTDGRNLRIVEPVVQDIIAEIKAREIDVLVVDPFVSTHQVNENDNNEIQRVAEQWVRIADETNCSVELIHHVTKGNIEVTADSGRGAGALKDKARHVRVLNAMTAEEASKAGVADPAGYFRIDTGKANIGRTGGRSQWRHMASVPLGNGPKGILYRGDEIGVVEPWEWPSAETIVEEVSPDVLAGLKARLGAGSYRESEQAADWAGHLVGELLGLDTSDKADKHRVKRMLAAWIAAGELAIEMRPDERRKPRKHIVPAPPP